jgi:RNA polymerase sigma factor (sigma-70 family)
MSGEPPLRSAPRKGNASPENEKGEAGAAVRRQFDRLLSSPHYERLRERLIRIFARRGCGVPEELADETISRVLAKLSEICRDYEGAPERYFYGVARNVLLEHLRRPKAMPYDDGMDVPAGGDESDIENAHRCLERCVSALPPSERELIQAYYLYDRSAKIDHRRELASRLGLGLNALRIKAFRVRQRLHRCVTHCLDEANSD